MSLGVRRRYTTLPHCRSLPHVDAQGFVLTAIQTKALHDPFGAARRRERECHHREMIGRQQPRVPRRAHFAGDPDLAQKMKALPRSSAVIMPRHANIAIERRLEIEAYSICERQHARQLLRSRSTLAGRGGAVCARSAARLSPASLYAIIGRRTLIWINAKGNCVMSPPPHAPQQRLNFFPLPHGHALFRPIRA